MKIGNIAMLVVLVWPKGRRKSVVSGRFLFGRPPCGRKRCGRASLAPATTQQVAPKRRRDTLISYAQLVVVGGDSSG